MVGLDTNVLVRYLTQDDATQSRQATQLFEKHIAISEYFFISGIILCELIWVLESAYDYPKTLIVQVLEKILTTKQFKIEAPAVIWQAFYDYRNSNLDFSDSYIAHLNHYQGCETTFTFDKKAAKLNLFSLLSTK